MLYPSSDLDAFPQRRRTTPEISHSIKKQLAAGETDAPGFSEAQFKNNFCCIRRRSVKYTDVPSLGLVFRFARAGPHSLSRHCGVWTANRQLFSLAAALRAPEAWGLHRSRRGASFTYSGQRRWRPVIQRTVPVAERMTTLSVVMWLWERLTPFSIQPSVTPVAEKMTSPEARSVR